MIKRKLFVAGMTAFAITTATGIAALASQGNVNRNTFGTGAQNQYFAGQNFSNQTDGVFDKGMMNDNGELLLHDRQVDLVETLESTLAIEDYLLDHLAFLEEVVIIRDNNGYPQPIVAIADGEQFQDELWFKAIENLPHLNEPIIMEYKKIPRTATMKVQRRALEQLLFNK